MPFIPHTEEDVRAMLSTIGADTIQDLFDEIPRDLLISELDGVPDALSERWRACRPVIMIAPRWMYAVGCWMSRW